MHPKDIRIVFMGTPDFAVESLKALIENDYQIVGVITAPDKPAGRGRQLSESAVKQYAIQQNLKVLQPEKLKNPEFIAELESLKADLQIMPPCFRNTVEPHHLTGQSSTVKPKQV